MKIGDHKRNLEKIIEMANKLVTREQTYYTILDFFNSDKFILYGASNRGKEVKEKLESLNKEVIAFVDSDPKKWNTTFCGLPVVSPLDIKKNYGNVKIVVSTMYWKEVCRILEILGYIYYRDYVISEFFLNYYDEIYKTPNSIHCGLLRFGDVGGYTFLKLVEDNIENIFKVLTLLKDKESRDIFINVISFRIFLYSYIENHILRFPSPYKYEDMYFHQFCCPKKGDIILDGGAWDGDTILRILERRIFYKKIYAFEVSKPSFDELEKLALNLRDIFVYRKALWIDEGRLLEVKFLEHAPFASYVSEVKEGDDIVETISIDSFVKTLASEDDLPTFIKLDIEGSERFAILGAKNLISNYTPNMAITVYHRPSDLWEIPLLINEINSKYWFSFAHYSPVITESVLYCYLGG